MLSELTYVFRAELEAPVDRTQYDFIFAHPKSCRKSCCKTHTNTFQYQWGAGSWGPHLGKPSSSGRGFVRGMDMGCVGRGEILKTKWLQLFQMYRSRLHDTLSNVDSPLGVSFDRSFAMRCKS